MYIKRSLASVAGKTLADFPELLKQWHPTKNGDLVPEKVAPRSNRRVWWICSKNSDHNWDAVIAQRTRKYERQDGTDEIGVFQSVL
jgi:hypothetical protein